METTYRSPFTQVIESSGLVPELQAVAAQEAIYTMNCMPGWRPSDAARAGVRWTERAVRDGGPLASPTATRMLEDWRATQ